MQVRLCDSCGVGSTPIVPGTAAQLPLVTGTCDSCGALEAEVRSFSLRQLVEELITLREAAREKP